MRPYGLDLRWRILEAYDNQEGSVRELAEQFAVAPNTVQNYLNLRRQTGEFEPRAPGGGGSKPLIDERGLQQVRQLVDERPDASECDLARKFEQRCHIAVSRSTIGRALRHLGLTYKKNAARHRAGHRRGARRA